MRGVFKIIVYQNLIFRSRSAWFNWDSKLLLFDVDFGIGYFGFLSH